MLNNQKSDATGIQVFNSTMFGEIRTIIKDGECLFVASDVAKALGYSVPQKAVLDHCKHCSKMEHPYNKGTYMNIIPESDMYRLTMKSKLPNAELFQDWVCEEVIPAIRKTGGYISTKQDDTPEEIMARALIVAQETIKRKEEKLRQLEEKNAKQEPLVSFAQNAFKAEGKVDIGQAAKILGLPFGRNTLFKKLKEAGVFFANRNEPKQKYIDAGYFEMTLLPPIHRDNHPDLLCQKVLCKPKGLAYINHLFGGNPSDGKLAKIR